MVLIPKDIIDIELNSRLGPEEYPRPYLGLSGNGEECLRSMQYSWRLAYKRAIPARITRLFNDGHAGEENIKEELKKIGCKIIGEQTRIYSTAGHWKGHIDGIIIMPGTAQEYLLEIKTHNQKYFNQLLKHGVQKAFPKYYDQMQAYMSHTGIPKRAKYVGKNKNDSTIKVIDVPYDEARATELKSIRMDVITSDRLLPKLTNAAVDYFKCRFCSAVDVCCGDKPIQRNCRTCDKVDIMDKGIWHCTDRHLDLTNEQQETGCDKWALDEPYFIPEK